MLKIFILAFACLAARPVMAQEYELDTNALRQLFDDANEWAQDNLDENALHALQAVDREQVEQFLRDFQSGLQGEYVLDLVALKDAAKIILPLLEGYEETRPYSVWLRSRLDYFEVAEELRRTSSPQKTVTVQTPKPLPNPPAKTGREAWQKSIQQRPLAKGVEELVAKLKPVFRETGVPPELIWIAEVESSFDPRARSPVGAAGLFQLMPATAKQYGLRRWPRDQRYQSEPSARAAAQHLKHLYRQFKDWRLAVAAYNAGEGRVGRLLKNRGADSFDAIATALPAETQMFVPKVEAIILRREGISLSKLGAR